MFGLLVIYCGGSIVYMFLCERVQGTATGNTAVPRSTSTTAVSQGPTLTRDASLSCLSSSALETASLCSKRWEGLVSWWHVRYFSHFYIQRYNLLYLYLHTFIMSHKVVNIQSRFRTSYSIMECRKVFLWKPQVCMYIRLVLTETSFIVMLWNYFTHNPQSKQWWLWLVEVAVTIAMFKPHQMPEHQTSETVRAVITVRNKSLYQ